MDKSQNQEDKIAQLEKTITEMQKQIRHMKKYLESSNDDCKICFACLEVKEGDCCCCENKRCYYCDSYCNKCKKLNFCETCDKVKDIKCTACDKLLCEKCDEYKNINIYYNGIINCIDCYEKN